MASSTDATITPHFAIRAFPNSAGEHHGREEKLEDDLKRMKNSERADRRDDEKKGSAGKGASGEHL